MKKIFLTLIMALIFILSTLSFSTLSPTASFVDVVSAATHSEPEPTPTPTPEPEPIPEPQLEPSDSPSSNDLSSPLAGYSSWAEEELIAAYELGLIPDSLITNLSSPITRLEFATLAVHFYETISETPVSYDANSPFVDTSDTAVLKAYALGITSGQGNQRFNPEGLVTRQEMATFVYRTLTAVYGNFTEIIDDPDYDDFDAIADWAVTAIRFTNAYSIISGTDNHHFSPLMTATDEMAILLLYRSLSNSEDYELEAMIEDNSEKSTYDDDFDEDGHHDDDNDSDDDEHHDDNDDFDDDEHHDDNDDFDDDEHHDDNDDFDDDEHHDDNDDFDDDEHHDDNDDFDD